MDFSFVLIGLCFMTLKCAAGNMDVAFQRPIQQPPIPPVPPIPDITPPPSPQPQPCATKAHSSPPQDHITKIRYVNNMTDLDTRLKHAVTKLVILVFVDEKCDQCKEKEPFIEQLAREYDAVMLKVDVDKFKEAAKKYKIRNANSLPVFVFIKLKEEVVRFTRPTPEDERKIIALAMYYKQSDWISVKD